MMAALVLVVLFYFGAGLISYLVEPFSTTVAYEYTSDHSVIVSGYVVREEEALSADGDLAYFSRSEGERVSKGGNVALLYGSGGNVYTACALE